MGWEMRGKAGPYYTRTRREGGRFVRQYFGRGELAHLLARLDASDREDRDEAAATERAQRSAVAEAFVLLADLETATDVVARAALVGAGFRQHHHGEWRRRRRHGDEGDGQTPGAAG
jgi:hypothetical protein